MVMFSRFRSRKTAPTFRAPDGVRLYAIGDIHGRADLLDSLLVDIKADCAGHPHVEVIFLGDYIDRGPGSAAVIDRILSGPSSGQKWTSLIGNHEAVLLHLLSDAQKDESTFPSWLHHGGRETLASYGLPADIIYGDDLSLTMNALSKALPAAHRDFLHNLDLSRQVGDYLFVHAGIRPGVPLDEQRRRDLIWIRDTFLEFPGDHGVHVVHGHSITAKVDERHNRTGIDTGAYASGKLTALMIEGTERRYLST